jgi:hypothetical protein
LPEAAHIVAEPLYSQPRTRSWSARPSPH